jgi:hypothetical protein
MDVEVIMVAGMDAATTAGHATGVPVTAGTTTVGAANAAGITASGDAFGPRRNGLPGWSTTWRTCKQRRRPSKNSSPR